MSRISCIPIPNNELVISSYSSVRLQQPKTGLSVESEMPKEIMMNPEKADESPSVKIDKMESVLMKDEQVKGIQKLNMDDETITKPINEKKNSNDDEKPEIEPKIVERLLDEKDFLTMMFSKEEPVGFSLATTTTTESTTTSDTTTEIPTTSNLSVSTETESESQSTTKNIDEYLTTTTTSSLVVDTTIQIEDVESEMI